ncbi:MAG: DEAD/DEAH box helicase [Acidimicrobiia bacterium]|nr:DEAD/DEAH box helicase [Acidimicrobiia bacterium]
MSELGEYDFELDRFQRQAHEAIDRGKSVLVAAPTGSGKTVVAEHAIARALRNEERSFYTTPIKALSNQKFHDLREQLGPARVGLLTGDNSINPDAPVVVMTTEVLRNMLYGHSGAVDDLGCVILDEVHYLEDAYRGPVWEEVIIHLPHSVRIVGLSATVSNADELAEWMTSVRGPTVCVVETRRPVELRHLYAIGERRAPKPHLIPTLIKGRPNREGYRFDPTPGRRGRGRPRRPYFTPRRLEMIESLRKADLLPVIYFIFSRAACHESMQRCLDAGLVLTTEGERVEIDRLLDERVRHLCATDLAVLGFDELRRALRAGVAAHHAGMVPAFKEAVERCFVAGLVKVVFATETLALGINMPARSVVIEKLSKFTGEHHEMLTPGQFTQLTGRAGRRGIDDLGTAVVLWSPYVPFDDIARLARSREFELRSAFRPTYNMAANLVNRYEEEQAHRLLASSFAQFQTRHTLERMQQDLDRGERRRNELAERLGDIAAVRQRVAQSGTQAVDLTDTLSRLQPGEVVDGLPDVDRAAVLSVAYRGKGRVRLRVIDRDANVSTFDQGELPQAPVVVGAVELPAPYEPAQRRFQDDVAHRLRTSRFRRATPADASGEAVPEAGGEAAMLGRYDRLEDEVKRLRAAMTRRAGTIDEQFAAVMAVLEDTDHRRGWELTAAGHRLRGIYHERDLLISLAIGDGLFDGLDAPTLAGLASCLTYEHRSADPPPSPWFPDADARRRATRLERLARDLQSLEDHHGVPASGSPDATLFAVVHAWTAGQDLEDLLDLDFLSGGDFVRNMKQLIDLLRQLGHVADRPATAAVARQAADALHRGVVAASTAIDDEPTDAEAS